MVCRSSRMRARASSPTSRGSAAAPGARPADCKRVYHLYMVFAEDRDGLFDYCLSQGVEAKIHYPIPLYQQEGLRQFGFKPGDFPVTDRHAREIITFPADQHLTREELGIVIETVRRFYAQR